MLVSGNFVLLLQFVSCIRYVREIEYA
jgi:hypothetical protein